MHNNHVNKNDLAGRIGIGLTLLIAIGVGIAFGFGIETTKQVYNGGYLNSDLCTWNWRKIADTPTCFSRWNVIKKILSFKNVVFFEWLLLQ